MAISINEGRRRSVEESSEDDYVIPPSPTFFCVQGTSPTMIPVEQSTTSRSMRRERPNPRRARRSNRHGQNSRTPRRSREQRPSSSQTNNDASNNPYIVVVVPSSTDTNNNSNGPSTDNNQNTNNLSSISRCWTCVDSDSVNLIFRLIYLTCCEFFPWVIGSIFIYYAYQSWGLTAAVSAFMFMMSMHGVLRFIKTRGSYTNGGCFQRPITPQRGQNTLPQPEVTVTVEDADPEDTSDSSEDFETDSQTELRTPEAPPSYETATLVDEDTQKHLICHLTPTRPRQNLEEKAKSNQEEAKKSTNTSKDNFLSVPTVYFGRKTSSPATTDDEDDFVFLPSYFDAVRRASLATEDDEDDDYEDNDEYEINEQENEDEQTTS